MKLKFLGCKPAREYPIHRDASIRPISLFAVARNNDQTAAATTVSHLASVPAKPQSQSYCAFGRLHQ
jgi:hypothetical protein